MQEPSKTPEDMAKFLRVSWETHLKLMEMVQGQTEQVLEMMLEQSHTLRDEGVQMVKQWAEVMTQTQSRYKQMMEENLDKIEGMVKRE